MEPDSHFVDQIDTKSQRVKQKSDQWRGLMSMVVACVFFAAMNSLAYAAYLREPGMSPLVGSFARIGVNLLLVVAAATALGKLSELPGDWRWTLWARGGFGSLSVMCSFAAVAAIGAGEASFLHASNGVFTALFAPLVVGQRNSRRVWVAILGAIFGLYLLFEPRFADVHPYGRTAALASGLFASLAYLMIARAGRDYAPMTVIFYLCIVSVFLHIGTLLVFPVIWPKETVTYMMLIGAGIVGSAAQLFLTRAYQTAPAALNSAVAYLQPVLNMLIGVWVFERLPDGKAWLGAVIVVIFGVMLPLTKVSRFGFRR